MKTILIFLTSLIIYTGAQAKIWLPYVLSDNMVLQRNSKAVIWGWTTNGGEQITVTPSWDNKGVSVKANQGRWSVEIPTPKAGGPFTISIKGHEEVVLKNVMSGEVWVCSGQSNMAWTPKQGLVNAETEIANANFPKIRFYNFLRHKSDIPEYDARGEWVECSPETMQNFSSVAYFFAREIHQRSNMAIGLIYTNWGGTPIEPWIPKEVVEKDPVLVDGAKKIKDNQNWPTEPGVLYNGMIHPFLKLDIAGAIWYQGESNRVNALSYYKSFPALINSWRKAWGKDFPFYYVQIAPFEYKDSEVDAAVVRDAQLQALSLPNTGMAVTMDIGDLTNIHPANKQEVGRRLALWALAKTYGVNIPTYSGPVFLSMDIEDSKARVVFKYANNGLIIKGKEAEGFFIAGKDKVFYEAKAKVTANTVEVWSGKVKDPVAVRYGFSDTAQPNLFNIEGLPASPFRTDKWKP